MIYGMYLSATGVITSAYRQDVIANNLANAQTTGFKKDLATFQQRRAAAAEHPDIAGASRTLLDRIGGGTLASPTRVDDSDGTVESTDNDLDAAIVGRGYFTVAGRDGQMRLTRNGHFQVDATGHLTLANAQQNQVLDASGQPIMVSPTQPLRFMQDGSVQQNNQIIARLGVSDVADAKLLKNDGGTLLSYSGAKGITPIAARVEGGALEGSNVDPATELADLMDTQRQLEANANMIRYQDQTLDKLVNDVGKIG